MKIEDARRLDPVERFLYWCGERHRVYLKKQAGEPKPWTDDAILQAYYFTNVYRELDKTTVWFRDQIREPLRESLDVIFATVCFRWFNYIPTGRVLVAENLMRQWDSGKAVEVLGRIRATGGKIFTGAFIVNSPANEPKLEAICRRVGYVWADREQLKDRAREWKSLRQAHGDVMRYEGLGGFAAYEIVCDLRYTSILERADDVRTWSNPGPGAVRGLYRALGREIKNKSNATAPPVPHDWSEQTTRLLALLDERYPEMPTFEAREVEMSLCEFDKYTRLLFGDGKSKRTYPGSGGGLL